jgi:hypothetical protein
MKKHIWENRGKRKVKQGSEELTIVKTKEMNLSSING